MLKISKIHVSQKKITGPMYSYKRQISFNPYMWHANLKERNEQCIFLQISIFTTALLSQKETDIQQKW
jgi:hypothetical protein